MKAQRTAYTNLVAGKTSSATCKVLRVDRRDSLNYLGFNWYPQMTFGDRLVQIRTYKQQHPNSIPPRSDPTGLGLYLFRVRKAWRMKSQGLQCSDFSYKFTDDQFRQLREAGVYFSYDAWKEERKVEKAMGMLRQFKQQEGHTFNPYRCNTKSKSLKWLDVVTSKWMVLYFKEQLPPLIKEQLTEIEYERLNHPKDHWKQPVNRPETKFFIALAEMDIIFNVRDEYALKGINMRPDGLVILYYNNGLTIAYGVEIEESRHDQTKVTYQQKRAFTYWTELKRLGVDGFRLYMVNVADRKDNNPNQVSAVANMLKEAFTQPDLHKGGLRKTYVDFPQSHFHLEASKARVIKGSNDPWPTTAEQTADEKYHFYVDVTIVNNEGVPTGI